MQRKVKKLTHDHTQIFLKYIKEFRVFSTIQNIAEKTCTKEQRKFQFSRAFHKIDILNI